MKLYFVLVRKFDEDDGREWWDVETFQGESGIQPAITYCLKKVADLGARSVYLTEALEVEFEIIPLPESISGPERIRGRTLGI